MGQTFAVSLLVVLLAGSLAWRSFYVVDQLAVDVGPVTVFAGSHFGYVTTYVSVYRYGSARYDVTYLQKPSDWRSPSGLIWFKHTAHWDYTLYAESSGYRVAGVTFPLWVFGAALLPPALLIAGRRLRGRTVHTRG